MSDTNVAIKGLMLTPPLLGRIAIGHMEMDAKTKKNLPKADDHFTITSQIKRNGEWVDHPMHEELISREAEKTKVDKANLKLRSIPVRMMFDDPALNMRAEFTCFERGTARPLCVGDGESARRVDRAAGVVTSEKCQPASCAFGQANNCKAFGRLNVQIEGQGDDLGTYIFRTTSFNSIRTIASRMQYLHGVSNGQLAGIPLDLVLRGKSTAQSFGSAIYYVDLVVRQGMTLVKAVQESQDLHKAWQSAGLSREHFEEQARQGMLNGLFEDVPEEVDSILEEFFNENLEAKKPEMEVTSIAGLTTSLEDLHTALDNVENAEQPKGKNPAKQPDLLESAATIE